MQRNRERWNRAVSRSLLVLILLASAEVGSFVLTRLRPKSIRPPRRNLPKISPGGLSALQVHGCQQRTRLGQSCRRSAPCKLPRPEVTYSYDAARVRRHGKRSPQEAVVVVTGDSYTQGADVADEETYPAALERMLGVGVANFGVSGYGSEQALLKLESLIDRFPRARVAVLSIFSDDTPRMMNSFRPCPQPRDCESCSDSNRICAMGRSQAWSGAIRCGISRRCALPRKLLSIPISGDRPRRALSLPDRRRAAFLSPVLPGAAAHEGAEFGDP